MAQISETQIANMALSHIGARSTIENLDEVSTEAEQAKLWYDWSRIQTLEAYDWSFARKRVVLTLHADTISTVSNTPLAGVWGYRYKYPANCVVARKIQNPNAPPLDAVPFEVELDLDGVTKTILTDMQNAVLVYTHDQEIVSLFSPGFVQAFSFVLASHMAFSLSGKLKLEQTLLAKAIAAVNHAAAMQANELVDPAPRDTDWIRDRSGSSLSTSGEPWRALPDGNN